MWNTCQIEEPVRTEENGLIVLRLLSHQLGIKEQPANGRIEMTSNSKVGCEKKKKTLLGANIFWYIRYHQIMLKVYIYIYI